MKRFLTTLAILLVVILAGLTTLVLLINPNDFRGYLIERVEKQSGYKLTLQDDMRWHVWPKLSIISGKMSLTAPGATQPLVSADNIRLDVELWPLLSHQLAVKEVMLKGAVVQHIPESQAIPNVISPNTSPISSPAVESKANRWQLDIAKVNISDSLIIWQMKDGEQINFRDINLLLKTDDKQQIKLEMSTKVNRDRREMRVNIAANADMRSYPYQINGNISQFDYSLSGMGIPESGITGSLTSDFSYKDDNTNSLSLENLIFSANDSELKGAMSADFSDKYQYHIALQGESLDLNKLLPELADNKTTDTAVVSEKNGIVIPALFSAAYAAPAPNATIMKRPVISTVATQNKPFDLTALNNIEFSLGLSLNQLIYKDLAINHFKLTAENSAKALHINTLTGQILDGHFSLPTVISTSIIPAQISMNIKMNDLPLQPILRVLAQPENMTGLVSATGHLEGVGYQREDILSYWQGALNASVKQFKMQGLNIPQIIQQSIAQVTDKVIYPEEINNYTQAENVATQLKLMPKGRLAINSLEANAPAYRIKGQGEINLRQHNLDLMLLVNIKKGWGKENDLIRQLAKIDIPLRLYGKWSEIQYEFNVDKLLRGQLQQRAKQALGEWLNQQEESTETKALNQLLKKL